MAIMTVLGPVADLGGSHCQMHEHLFVQETPASLRNPALKIDDEAKSIEELRRYRAAGGGAILDAQPVGAGRDLAALRRISRASGVDIISVTGYHLPAFYPKNHWILSDSVEELAERFLSELNEGVETREGRISPGAVKAAIGPEGAAGQFRVCLRAAARAAARAQVPLILHTEKGIGAPEAVKLCAGEGLDPARIAVCHADRQADDPRPHDEIAASGVYMEYDTIARYKYHDDESERRLILRMIEKGHLDRLLISLDTTAARLRSYGDPTAPGLDFILREFIPSLLDAGLDQKSIDTITVSNPVRIFG